MYVNVGHVQDCFFPQDHIPKPVVMPVEKRDRAE